MVTNPVDQKTARARTWLGWGAAGLLAGIAISATGNAAVGSWISVACLLATTIGLHTFGRTGPDKG